MFTLRALARRAPRSASQIARYTTTTSSTRPTIQRLYRPSNPLSARWQPLTAPFSTTPSRFDDKSDELAAKLNSEISIESENNASATDSDSNVKAFLEQHDYWEVENVEGEQDVFMTRTYDDEKITVSFSIADFNSPSMMPEDEADEAFVDEDDDVETAQSGGANTKGAINQGRTDAGNIKVAPEDRIAPGDREELRNEEDDMESQQAFPANVHVLIQRPSKSGALRIHLVTDGSAFTVHNVTHLPISPNASAKDLLRQPQETAYTGPPFQQLDEDLQSHVEQYLEVRGMDTHLALFIPDYIDVKEQNEYLAWLGRMKDFVE